MTSVYLHVLTIFHLAPCNSMCIQAGGARKGGVFNPKKTCTCSHALYLLGYRGSPALTPTALISNKRDATLELEPMSSINPADY
jgi:hypothetical protein